MQGKHKIVGHLFANHCLHMGLGSGTFVTMKVLSAQTKNNA